MHRAVLAVLLALGLAAVAAAPAAAHPVPSGYEGDRAVARQQVAGGVPVPVLASPNVRLVATFPDTLGISGVFGKSAPIFVMSTTKGLSVYDVADPRAPRLAGFLPLVHFENEAITYGERRGPGGVAERFVLVGYDLFGVTPTDPSHVGTTREVAVVDVTDPAAPRIRSTVPTTTSTHTAACIRETACDLAYTAGERGRFSIIDLTDLDAPREIDADPVAAGVQSFTSPAAGPNPVFTSGAGHKWNFDGAGFGIHTGSGGSAFFDVRDPRAPRLVTTTDADGTRSPWNDFIHHNSDRPNATAFTRGAAPSVANGNVLLVTEEDYENPDCATAGSFQTWYVERLDGTPAAVRPLDRINPVGDGGEIGLPLMAFCSAHWFDHHPSGIVAQAYYQGGVRFVDVRDPRDLKEYGHFVTGVSEVWDTYWVPERNRNGIATGKKSNLVYAVDLIRGLDVLEVDLPRTDSGGLGGLLGLALAMILVR